MFLSVAGMSEASKIKVDISANNSYQVCSSISNISQSVSQKILEEFKTKTQISKTMVASVVDSIYGQDKKKIAEVKFSSAKSDIQSIVIQFVKDPKKKKEIIVGYSKLNLYWMEKPADSAYMKNSDGVLVLHESKAASQLSRSFSDDIYGIFSDHNLSKLTELNANYMPPVFLGKGSKYQERVNISPVILSSGDKYPNALLVVLAHEAGHKIGPEVTKINKYDLSSDYKNLLACYKDSKSINLQSSQMDETIAD